MSYSFNLKSYVTDLDTFGEPVKLNYRGKQTYKTFCGALLTLALRFFLIAFAI